MKHLFSIPLFFLAFPLAASLPFIPALEEKIIAAQKLTELPGCAVAIVNDKEIVYAKGFGVRKKGEDKLVDTDTLFQIGSVTKGFTAALIAKLMSEGKLDWNERVCNLYPRFRLSQKQHTEELTLKDILAQRSGLPLYAGDEFIEKGKDYLYVLDKLASTPQELDATKKHFSYQNSLYCITEPIIVKATGKDWHRAIQEDLLQPMSIQNASSSFQAIAFAPNAASPHNRIKGQMIPIERSHFGYLVAPAGGLNMNIKDLARYLIFQLNHGNGMIAPPYMKELHDVQVSTDEKKTTYNKLFFPIERVTSSAYCLGLRSCDWAGHKVMCHGGAVNGQLTAITFLPQQKLGLAIISNARTDTNSLVHKYFLDLALNLEPIDWFRKYEEQKNDLEETETKESQKAKKVQPKRKKPQKIAKIG